MNVWKAFFRKERESFAQEKDPVFGGVRIFDPVFHGCPGRKIA
jgi:hypothetical protein